MKYFWISALLTLISAHAETMFQSGPQRVSLLELYTSEGCSSCPPAESWLGQLKTSGRLWKQIVPVAFHVDYWDDLGWKDRFARQEYSARQRAYFAIWGTSSVYTPGFVLDGQEWKGWFNGDPLPDSHGQPAGKLEVRIENGAAWIKFSGHRGLRECEAHIAPMAMDADSDVLAGENRGRKLSHDFVALRIVSRKLEHTNGEFTIELPIAIATAKAIAVWVTPIGSASPLQAAGGYLK
jgi:hypothetical protein